MKVKRYDRKFQVLDLLGRRHCRSVWYWLARVRGPFIKTIGTRLAVWGKNDLQAYGNEYRLADGTLVPAGTITLVGYVPGAVGHLITVRK
jgi:hypothetical protein